MKDFGSYGSGLNFGRLRPLCGPLQRLHPGIKIGTLLSGITAISLIPSISALTIILIFVFCSAAAAGLKPRALIRPLLPVLPFIGLVLLIHALSLPRLQGEAMLSVKDIRPVVIMAQRILSYMTLLGLVSAATSASEISYGIEALCAPLERFGFPAGELGLIATVTFNFIPFLREESERLAKAQTARGGSLGFRSANPFKRIRASLPLMIPLFIGTLRRAEILAESMHLRGYREDRVRNRLHRYSTGRIDRIWATVLVLTISCALLVYYLKLDALIGSVLFSIPSLPWRKPL